MADGLDIWTPIFPADYFARPQGLASVSGPLKRWLTLRSLYDLDTRFRLMDAFEGIRQVLMPSMPPFDGLGEAAEAAELARLMNGAVAGLFARHIDRFPPWVAGLSLLDPEAAVARAVAMGARGVLICTHVSGLPLDDPRFEPVFAVTGLAIRLHPVRGPVPDDPTEQKSHGEIRWCFGRPYEPSVAMSRLVLSGLLDRHPGLSVLTHHMAAMIPYFAGGTEQSWGREMGARTSPADAHLLPRPLKRPPLDYFKAFPANTALSGATGVSRPANRTPDRRRIAPPF